MQAAAIHGLNISREEGGVGSTTVDLLAMFEVVAFERYAVLTLVFVAIRVRSLGRVLGYLAKSGGEKARLDPQLHSAVPSVAGRVGGSKANFVPGIGGSKYGPGPGSASRWYVESQLELAAPAKDLHLELEGRAAKRQWRGERSE